MQPVPVKDRLIEFRLRPVANTCEEKFARYVDEYLKNSRFIEDYDRNIDKKTIYNMHEIGVLSKCPLMPDIKRELDTGETITAEYSRVTKFGYTFKNIYKIVITKDR